ncbi:MAG: hypothetical protein K2Z81_10000, partial [Cyanobacteria bacterium]|nr:hypothetical protein [Cyanobacteriota bacterium]
MPRIESSPRRESEVVSMEHYRRRSVYDEPIREMNRWFPFFLGSTSSLVLVSIALALVLPRENDSRFDRVTMLPPSTTVSPQPVITPVPSPPVATVTAEESTITGIIDTNTLTSSLYWTMRLRGDTWGKQEADMIMRLPEGAAVTRATLWVNGVPQEAAFNTTGRVESAYNAVVSRMRDPLLITCKQQGEVSIKAFPIEQDRDLQLRIGITAPVQLTRAGTLSLSMPFIEKSNMTFSHSQNVHLESDATLSATNDDLIVSEDAGKSNLHGNIAVERLKQLRFTGQRSSRATRFATRATHSLPRGFVVAELNQGKNRLELSKTIEQPNCEIVTSDDAAHRLSKVWAIQEITRLIAQGDASVASDLGITYRIVSPVTGATVLETNADYQNFGLHRDLYRSLSYGGHKARRAERLADKEYAPGMPADDAMADAAPAPEAAPAPAMEETRSNRAFGSTPRLQGATNGTIAPQASASFRDEFSSPGVAGDRGVALNTEYNTGSQTQHFRLNGTIGPAP